MGKNRKKIYIEWRRGLLVLAGLLVVALISLEGTRQALLRNAAMMGKNLMESYVQEEERSVSLYRTVVQMGANQLRELEEKGAGEEELLAWANTYLDQAIAVVGEDQAAAYAVIGGRLIARIPIEGSGDYEAKTADWYRETMAADGSVIFTDAYPDQLNGGEVVTVAAGSAATGNAVLLDISMEDFSCLHDMLELPEGGAYYLCDAKGTLLYSRSASGSSREQAARFIHRIYEMGKRGEMQMEDTIQGLDGSTRGVYVRQMENGWYCVLTIPQSVLLEGLRDIILFYGGAFALFLAGMILFWIRDYFFRMRMERVDETLRVLGNSYFALYYLDLRRGTYEMIKGSDLLRRTISPKGEYQVFYEAAADSLDGADAEDFLREFSLEKLRELQKERTEDFGGDFQRRINGEYRWINVRLLLDASMSRGEAVLCFRQVDEEKRRQLRHIQLMEDALDEAESSRQSQMQFFSNMSHDMRTPLNVILGMTDLALRPDSTAQQKDEYLLKIQNSGRQLLSLINDILDVSRLKSGQVALEKKAFSICGETAACMEPFREMALREGKRFETELQVETEVVLGDPARLSQILNNLLSNAFRFTQKGDRIRLSLLQRGDRGGEYRLTVEDTGAGMSEEFLPKLFEPYVRETRFGARGISGTGLGMPIVKALVTRMGGEIQVESRLGEGSRFIVTLPFAPGELPRPAVLEPQEDAASLKGKRVLTAEDNELNMEITSALLEDMGMLVVQAVNGREAVAAFARSSPGEIDAVLMDMQMPEMDGCEAAAAIRRLDRPDAAGVPIIALTANAFAEDIAKTARAGMNAHLSKPIDAALMRTVLLKFLGRKAETDHE